MNSKLFNTIRQNSSTWNNLSITPFPFPMFCPSFLRFQHVTSSHISISRLAYTLLNRAKLGQKLFCPPRDSTWRRYVMKMEKARIEHGTWKLGQCCNAQETPASIDRIQIYFSSNIGKFKLHNIIACLHVQKQLATLKGRLLSSQSKQLKIFKNLRLARKKLTLQKTSGLKPVYMSKIKWLYFWTWKQA